VDTKLKLKLTAPKWRLTTTDDFYTLLLYGTIDPHKFLYARDAKEVDKAIKLLYAFEVAMTSWSNKNAKDK
jgi:hypothetical protein